MQWNLNFSKNKLEFDFDHEIMIMITLFDRIFFLICEATLYYDALYSMTAFDMPNIMWLHQQ